MGKIAAALGLETKANDLASSLAEIRSAIEAKCLEQLDVAARPVDAAEVRRRVDAAITAAQNEGLVVSLGQSAPASRDIDRVTFNRFFERDLFGFAALFLPDNLRKVLIDSAEPGGLSASERADRLIEIDEELDALQRREEALCRHMEAGGTSVARRPDAPPHLLVAADEAVIAEVET